MVDVPSSSGKMRLTDLLRRYFAISEPPVVCCNDCDMSVESRQTILRSASKHVIINLKRFRYIPAVRFKKWACGLLD